MMRAMFVFVLSGLILTANFVSADVDIRKERIQFEKGKSSASVTGKIQGYQIVDYQLRAKAGQTMRVDFKPSNLSAYFNVLPPGTVEAIFIGSTLGNHFEGALPTDGEYTIRVYLMRSAARRNETANYSLEVSIVGEKTTSTWRVSQASGAMDRTLDLQGIRFQIKSANEGSINTLHIIPSGLEIDNTPIKRTIEGTVTGAEVADLNSDGSPEIYVYVTSAGSGSYGSLIAYSANNRKSLSEIYMAPITDDKKLSKGYMGHDEFAVVENILARRFPIYGDTDTNAKPTGGMRQIQYKLVPGEATWLLRVDRVVEY